MSTQSTSWREDGADRACEDEPRLVTLVLCVRCWYGAGGMGCSGDRGFYAFGDTRTLFSVVAWIASVRHRTGSRLPRVAPARWAVTGMAGAYTLSYAAGPGVTARLLRRKLGSRIDVGPVRRTYGKLLLAATAAGALGWAGLGCRSRRCVRAGHGSVGAGGHGELGNGRSDRGLPGSGTAAENRGAEGPFAPEVRPGAGCSLLRDRLADSAQLLLRCCSSRGGIDSWHSVQGVWKTASAG